MTTAVSRQINIPLIADFPNVLDELILSYVDRRSCVGAMAVHSEFSSRKAVVVMNKRFENEDAAAGRLGYPPSMIAMFKAHDLFLFRLPMFQLPQGKDVGRLEVEDVSSCLMRYRYNEEPPGAFILKIRKKKNAPVFADGALASAALARGIPQTMAFAFQAPSVDGKRWTDMGATAWQRSMPYQARHESEHDKSVFFNWCPLCSPFHTHTTVEGATTMLTQFLEGTDPCFELDGPVQQVDNPLRLAAPQEETAPEKESV